jgi:hypothetical protein
MATKLFSASPGSVSLVLPKPDEGTPSTPFSILIETEKWDYQNIQGIVTYMSMSHETNSQFVQTLSDDVYVTIFGSKIGSMSISGILFLNKPGVCGDGVTSSAEPLESFYKKFLDNCVITRKKHLTIQLGTVALKGFLVAFQLNVTDPQTAFGNFTMQFVLLPRKSQ